MRWRRHNGRPHHFASYLSLSALGGGEGWGEVGVHRARAAAQAPPSPPLCAGSPPSPPASGRRGRVFAGPYPIIMQRRWSRFGRIAAPLAVGAAVLALWEIIVRA